MKVFRGYIDPAYCGQKDAEAFDLYLHLNCRWSVPDFGGNYAWAADVPPRHEWAAEVAELNAHLEACELERAEH
jgi:hypothetical protein